MATIVLGDNPGPKRVQDMDAAYPEISVTLIDGEGATVILPYTDLENLDATIALMVEARDKLTNAIIAEYAQVEVPLRIQPGWQIEIDGRIVEVESILAHGDVVGVSFQRTPAVFGDPLLNRTTVEGHLSGYYEFPKDGMVTRIVRPDDLADIVR